MRLSTLEAAFDKAEQVMLAVIPPLVLAVIVVFALAMLGCATTTYYKDGATQANFTQDKYDCQQEAWRRTNDMGFAGNPIIASGYYKDCMIQKHGYRTTP